MLTPLSSRLVHWIASWAILWAPLWPVLSHALPTAAITRSVQVHICGDGKTAALVLPSPAQGQGHDHHDAGAHCAFCRTGDASTAILAALHAPLPGDAVQIAAYPALFYNGPAQSFAWTVAPPRGPPPAH